MKNAPQWQHCGAQDSNRLHLGRGRFETCPYRVAKGLIPRNEGAVGLYGGRLLVHQLLELVPVQRLGLH